MNIMLVLYTPTNSLILVDHLNGTWRNLGNSATDPVRDYYSRKPYITAYDKGKAPKGGAIWQDLIKAGTDRQYTEK